MSRLGRLLRVGLGLALGALACRPTPPRGAADRELAETVELLLGDDVRAARQLGAGEPRLALTGTGISGDSLGAFADVAQGECALLLGRGTRGVQDVDLFAFDEDGTVLASDEAATKNANLVLCPPAAARVFASARLAAGVGMFGMTLQTVAPSRIAELGRRFGLASSRASEVSELSSSWPGLDERLIEHRRRIGGRWETLRKVALPLDPRAYVNVSALIEPGTCLDLYVMPSEDVAHLELEVLDASGRWIGSGEARGVDRNLMVCSAELREVGIRSRPHAGRGLAALVVSTAGAAEVGASSSRFDLRPEGSLEARRRATDQRLSALGYARPRLLRQGALQTERRLSIPLALEAGCSRLDVLTAAPLRSLRAWLWDGRGQLMAEDVGGIDATLFACGPAQSVRLDLDTASRGGEFALEVRSSSVRARAADGNALAMGRLLSALDARGQLSLPRLPDVQLVRVSGTELARVSLVIPAGRCAQISAALGRDASGLELRLMDVTAPSEEPGLDGTEVGYGAYAASARMCAVKPAQERSVVAELRANVGEGAALWSSFIFDPDPTEVGSRAR